MKKLSIVAALLFAFGTVAFAQEKPAADKKADKKETKKADKKADKKMDKKDDKKAADKK
jgi:hypothetical protein